MILRHPVPRTLLVLGAVLLVAAVALGVLTARAAGGDDDRAAAVVAARTHLDALGAADPAGRARAADGATGAWRERLGDLGGGGRPTTTSVVRTAGLETLDGDAARVVAVGLVAGGTVPRTYRVEVTLVRVDDRWLVDDVVAL